MAAHTVNRDKRWSRVVSIAPLQLISRYSIPVEVEAGRAPEADCVCLEMIKSGTGAQTLVFPACSLAATLPQARYLSRFVQRRCPAPV